MCKLCGHNDNYRTALTAVADQHIAKMSDDIRSMVATYQAMRAKGRDMPLDVGTLILANQALTGLELSQLFAVAIKMLAEREARP